MQINVITKFILYILYSRSCR